MRRAGAALLALAAGLMIGGLAVRGVAHAASIERPNTTMGPVQLEVSKGVLVRLDQPATTVFVADPEIADIQVKTPRLIYLFGKYPGETTLFAVDANEKVLVNRAVKVNYNLARLDETLRTILPESQIEFKSVDGALVMTGAVATPAEAEQARRIAARVVYDPEKLVNQLAVTAPNQVHLRVRVAEVSRDTLKQFAINWNSVLTTGSLVVGLATGFPVATSFPFVVRGTSPNTVSARFQRDNLDLNGLIDALDAQGLITILAEPNLTATSGETATFLAGGEFPILVPESTSQAGRITVEFKQFGVQLAFTPTILEERIALQVAPEVSQLSSTGAVQLAGFSIPALTTRRAKTSVELASGQSFAIAGLIQNNSTHDISKFPGLGDVPILGALFRSDRFRRQESELVIIVTPYLVRPVSGHRLAAPTDGLRPPSDAERILYGADRRVGLASDKRGPTGGRGEKLTGPAGFVLD